MDDPFALRSQLPFGLLFLDQTPESALLLSPRQATLTVHVAYESTMAATDDLVQMFRQDDFATYGGMVTLPILTTVASGTAGGTAFVLDGETLRTSIDLRVGIARRFEVGLEIPVLSHQAGFLDSVIDSYHDRFNLPDGGRTGFADDRYSAGYVGDGQSLFFGRSPGAGLGDIVVSGRFALLSAGHHWPAIAAALSAKVPTGDADRLRGSGAVDYGTSLQISRSFGRSTLHAGLGYTVPGDWELAPGLPLKNPRSQYGTYVFAATRDTSFLLQMLRTRNPFPHRTGSDLGRVSWEVAVGLRHRLPRALFLEWALIENVDPLYNAPDVGAFFALAHRREPRSATETTGR
jgi:hypothetical protein